MSQAKFDKAVAIVQGLPKDGPVKPTQDDQLYFYKYYKQANIGDNTTARPGMLDFTGKAKWDAWTDAKGTATADAQAKYVAKLLEILKAAGDDAHVQEIESAA
ncbi:acyl-CoA-binding protein [Mycena belliarum]|uniref:Acyl-CoA-binding protein n=1 Tax=Mycena belliarum TaxID=1033014 RepID=A0AAD6UCL5_9AGAR|nr:acyl-CoA-binding protein [Mycena belliae]